MHDFQGEPTNVWTKRKDWLQHYDEPVEVIKVDNSGARVGSAVRVIRPQSQQLPAPSLLDVASYPRAKPSDAVTAAVTGRHPSAASLKKEHHSKSFKELSGTVSSLHLSTFKCVPISEVFFQKNKKLDAFIL